MLSLAGVIYCKSVRIAGDHMDEAIRQHIRKHYNLLIGERRAEEIKINLGSAYPGDGEQRTIDVKGRDLVDGFPKSVVLTEDDVREALRDSVMAIVETVRTCLEQTPGTGCGYRRYGHRHHRWWWPPTRAGPAARDGDPTSRDGRPGPDVLRGPGGRESYSMNLNS